MFLKRFSFSKPAQTQQTSWDLSLKAVARGHLPNKSISGSLRQELQGETQIVNPALKEKSNVATSELCWFSFTFNQQRIIECMLPRQQETPGIDSFQGLWLALLSKATCLIWLLFIVMLPTSFWKTGHCSAGQISQASRALHHLTVQRYATLKNVLSKMRREKTAAAQLVELLSE